MKRILVVTPWKRRWELDNSAGLADDYYFIDGFSRDGFEVHYLAPRHDGPPERMPGNYVVHEFPNVLDATERWPSLLRRPLWPVLFTVCTVFRGMQVARRHPPSLVLGQTHLSAWAVRILGRHLGVPSIVKLFGVVELDRTDWTRRKYLRKNLEQILAFKVPQDAWIILDDGTGGGAAARRHGVEPGRIHELPNGVNLEWADRAPDPNAPVRYGIPDGTAVVLFLARLTGWKRPELFIRMIPTILKKAHRPVRFLIAGGGPLWDSCREVASALGVSSAVEFLGPVAHETLPDLMSVTTVLVSTNSRSNRGITTCEAMVCGVPVVAFDVGDTRAVIRDHDTGRLVSEGDIEGFSRAVAELVDNETTRAQIGARARAFARESFTGWTDRVRMELGIVTGLLDRPHR